MRFWLLGMGMLVMVAAQAATGLMTIESTHGVPETVDRLTRIVESNGFRVFADIDHAAAAEKVELSLRPTRLLIFGKPRAGTLLMQSRQTMAIDLPLKYLVYEDADGKVWISWNAPGFLAQRHGLSERPRLIEKMTGILAAIAERAAGR